MLAGRFAPGGIELNITTYFENVFHQFYAKADEVDFFIMKAYTNYDEYKNTPIPKSGKHLLAMQCYFSAFLTALETCWEISKVSIDLSLIVSNDEKDSIYSQNKKPSEGKLENDKEYFKQYFETDDTHYYWFSFLKEARNASAHDGSLSLNGGNTEKFLFLTDIYRFRNLNGKKYEFVTAKSPSEDALTAMLMMAIYLIPLFESKLIRPIIGDEDQRQIALFRLQSIKEQGFQDMFKIMQDQITNALVEVQKEASLKQNNASSLIIKWNEALKKYS